MNFSVKNLFGEGEHIHIKLRISSHLLNESLNETSCFVSRILMVLLLSLERFSANLIASFSNTLHQSTLERLVSSLLFRYQFFALAVNNDSTFTLAGPYDFSNFTMIWCLTG